MDTTGSDYEFVILGSGEGSKYLAWTLAAEGKRVVVIERKYIGGSCPHIASLPTKNVVHSAKVAQHVRDSEEFGVLTDHFKIDMPLVRERKRRMVQDLVDIHL